MVFALLFGLSMDYEVFLIRRMQETWLQTHDNEEAVVAGIEHTARPIVAAAAIMAAVFGCFLVADVLELKQFGFALAVAVVPRCHARPAAYRAGLHAGRRTGELVAARLARPDPAARPDRLSRRSGDRPPVCGSQPAGCALETWARYSPGSGITAPHSGHSFTSSSPAS